MDKYSILFPKSLYPFLIDSSYLSLNAPQSSSVILVDSKNMNNNNELMKTVYDPIHGHMTFAKEMWSIIDTPHFQRLRKLKQLALVYLIFPGATHTRFEHSLGVGFLSNRVVSSLLSSKHHLSPEDLFHINAVTMAGLCHDIGHGPFSHLFDNVIKDVAPHIEWSHEDFAEKIIDDLIDSNHIEIDLSQLRLVKALIKGDNHPSFNMEYANGKQWLFQIVANQTNSIDVDKFDYICRDAYHTGLHSCGVDYHSIYNSTRIINDNICFDVDNELNIITLFKTRYKLHKLVYQQPKILCLNYMVREAIKLSKDYFGFEDALSDVSHFLSLNDSIFELIKHFDVSQDDDVRSDSKLQTASKIIRSIERRDIYCLAGMVLLPKHLSHMRVELKDILDYDNPKDDGFVDENDVILTSASIDYGFKDKNPFNSIFFFNKENENKCFKRNSNLLPEVFKEKYIALICKDNKKSDRVSKMFNHFVIKQFRGKINEGETISPMSLPMTIPIPISMLNLTHRKHGFLGNKRKKDN